MTIGVIKKNVIYLIVSQLLHYKTYASMSASPVQCWVISCESPLSINNGVFLSRCPDVSELSLHTFCPKVIHLWILIYDCGDYIGMTLYVDFVGMFPLVCLEMRSYLFNMNHSSN